MAELRRTIQAWRVRTMATAWTTGFALAGCNNAEDSTPVADQAVIAPVVSSTPTHSRFDQTYHDAVTTLIPNGWKSPPIRTISGKSTAEVHDAVRLTWPDIKLTDSEGNPGPILVSLDTELGPIEMTLFPDYAPNHVRNFLVLARLGYFNGLSFERMIRQQLVSDSGTQERVEIVTAGCPVGNGEPGNDHLGYFVRSEQSALSHDEGTVGFVRGDDPNSACCRFYICMTPATSLDGHFVAIGRVTQGLDVMRSIAFRPVKDSTTYPESEQPQVPVKIRQVQRK